MKKHVPDMEKAEQLHNQLQEMLAERRARQTEGVAALHRLLQVAICDTGQSGVCARFLLGLYNGSEHPFNLVDLRRLDESLHQDCLAVLDLDYMPAQEVHRYFKGGDRIWRVLAERWGGKPDAR
ncbi:hypothetical protein ACBQ16_03780 [Halopseudomonas bauzanensis]|uniref:DUF7673 family protein n=1 Tax=Halopseudomonas bauzanensis TaxID=653930 RepID=UPI00352604FC